MSSAESPTPTTNFEILLHYKILADETGKQLREENCLIQHGGTIRKLVMEAKEKFTPNAYKKGTLTLRNVTTFATRYALEVSVDIDGKAIDGTKYTANFIFNQESPLKAESSSTKSSNERALAAEFLQKQIRLEELDNDLIDIRRQLDEATKQKETMEIEKSKNDKLLKAKQYDLKKAQNQLDEFKKELETKREEKKALNERIDKKNKEFDSIRKQIREREKKLETVKKDLTCEVEELDKIITKKAKALEECEQLQEQKEQSNRALEDLRNEELLCRCRINEMQQEEKQFQLMLQELREHLGALQRQGQRTPLENEQQIQQQEDELAGTTTTNLTSPHPKAFTQLCMYYQRGDCWRGLPLIKDNNNQITDQSRDKCTFIHEMRTPKQRYDVNWRNSQESQQQDDLLENIKREERSQSRTEEEEGEGAAVITTNQNQGGGGEGLKKTLPIQIENIEGIIMAANKQQRQSNVNDELGQKIIVQIDDVEMLNNNERQNLEFIDLQNWMGIPQDNSQQVPYMPRIWNNGQLPPQQNSNNNIRSGQFFNTQPQPTIGGEYQINMMNNNNTNVIGLGRTLFHNNNCPFGGEVGGKFPQMQGHKRGRSKMGRPPKADRGNGSKRMRFGGRKSSRSNGRKKVTHRDNSISPIRNSSQLPSTSSTYHHQPRAKILHRITTNEPASTSDSHHSSKSIHSRLTFGE